MDQRGRRRFAVGAGDPDNLVRRQFGAGLGKQFDVADDGDTVFRCVSRNRVTVERDAGGDDNGGEAGEVESEGVGDA